MAVEVQVAATFLYARLAGDGPLTALVGDRIYVDLIPDGVPLPAVLFTHQAGVDYQLPGPVRVWSSMIWQVKGVAEGRSLSPLTQVADRIDQVLQAVSHTPAAGGTVHASVREGTVSYLEEDAGTVFRHLGGLYRLFVTRSAAA